MALWTEQIGRRLIENHNSLLIGKKWQIINERSTLQHDI